MLLRGLLRMREVVAGYQPLTDYLARYEQSPTHYVGIKIPAGDHEYPAICYAILKEERKRPHRHQQIGIAWFLMQPEASEDGIYKGVIELAEVGELIVAALRSDLSLGGQLGLLLDPDPVTLSDVIYRHPYYQGEGVFSLRVQER